MKEHYYYYVDDDEDDRMFFADAARTLEVRYSLFDACEPMLFALEQSVEKPTAVFADLNLPGMDGIELLRTLKSDGMLKHIPVIILSTSSSMHDIGHCFSENASLYIVKPTSIDALTEALKQVSLVDWSRYERKYDRFLFGPGKGFHSGLTGK